MGAENGNGTIRPQLMLDPHADQGDGLCARTLAARKLHELVVVQKHRHDFSLRSLARLRFVFFR